jgi:glutamate racemase
MPADPSQPIGVFDSGIGGLTVVSALMRTLPRERIVYFGDTARVPYGVKSPTTIIRYATEIADFLVAAGVKLLIIACNTMAAVAYAAVKERAPVPVLEVIDAGVRSAVAKTRSRRIGVIGTPVTIHSNAYARAIQVHDPEMQVFSCPCPLFVPLVEEGWLNHPVTRLTAEEYLNPLLAERIDTLVLGCTHYPLLKPLLQQVVGDQVELVDSAQAISRQAHALLHQSALANEQCTPPTHDYYVTDVPARFQEIGARFLGQPLSRVHLVQG